MHAAATSSATSSTKQKVTRRASSYNSSKQPIDLEELVEEEKEQKNWKGIFIAIVVIVLVFSCVSVAIVVVMPDEVIVRKGDKLSLEELVNDDYEAYHIEARWTLDGRDFMYKSRDSELIYYECESNFSTVYLDSSPFSELGASEYLVSPDKSYILFNYESKQIYDHYRLSKFKLYSTDTRLSRHLIGPHGQEFQYVTWSHYGQGLFVVQKNNIYFKESVHVTRSSFIRLTSSGMENVVYNGVPDWLFAESVLKTDNTLWLSPRDEYLAYLEINDTGVPEMSMTSFGNADSSYPDVIVQKFPKRGTAHPEMKFKIYSFVSNTTITIKPPVQFATKKHYLTSVTWYNNVSFAVVWMNGEQNITIVSICTVVVSTAKCRENLREEAEFGWIDPPNDILFTPTGSHYFISTPRSDGDGDSLRQVALIDASVDITVNNIQGKKIFVTISDIEVEKVVGYFNKTVYFLGVPQNDPKRRHLYSAVSEQSVPNFREVTCVSCNISDECLYVTASFGATSEYYILGCLGPGVPYYAIYETPESLLTNIEDNEYLRAALSKKLIPLPEYMNITLPDGDYILTKVILPPVLDFDEAIRYNLIIVPNEHIGDHSVTYKYHIGWQHFLASFRSIIVVTIDTSGSRGRGEHWLKSIYKHINARQTDEILAVMRHFRSLYYVNEQMGILGNGLGGHVALSTLSAEGNDVISCGAALAPIVDFSYMDSFSNDKYKGVPGQHTLQEPYLLSRVGNLKSHKLLLIHGMLDDRIHFRNTAQYVKSLVDENILHRFQVYPDTRDIYQDSKTRQHAISTVEMFFTNCFGLDPNADPVYVEEEEEE